MKKILLLTAILAISSGCQNLFNSDADHIKIKIFSSGDGFTGHFIKDSVTSLFANESVLNGSYSYEVDTGKMKSSVTITATGNSLNTKSIQIYIFKGDTQVKNILQSLISGSTDYLTVQLSYSLTETGTSTTTTP